MPTLESVAVYPVKSLDPEPRESARVRADGPLAGDREFAIVEEDGAYVNGKREPLVHRLRSSVDRDSGVLTLREHGTSEAHTFSLEDRADLESWLADYFDRPVRVRREARGMPDDGDRRGPTVISTGTLEAVADWVDRPVPEVRRRFRPNLVIEAGPFWEDRLYADREHVVAVRVGEVVLEGVSPCQRCVVPTRDPDTGEATPGFRRTFVEQRRETLPAWADRDWYDHYYRLMVNTRVPGEGGEIAIGDEVEILETRPR